MEKIVFLFPGQGSHYVSMSKTLCNQFPIAKQTFEEANNILGIDLENLCYNGPLGELSKPENVQVAILTSCIATYRVYMKEIGIVPQFCAGHSLGEYSALTCAGAIKFSDAVKIVRYRGMLTKEMIEKNIGSMTIIDGVGRDIVEEECKNISKEGYTVSISCYNSPEQTAISGHEEAVREVEEKLLEQECVVTPLLSSAPFHCSLMQEMADLFRDELGKYFYGFFKYPLVTNVSASPLTDTDKVIDNILDHMVKPVQWEASMNYLKRKGVTLAVEMGPKNLLTNLVKANVEGIEALCYGLKEDRSYVDEILSAYPGLKKHIPTVVTRCLAAAVATPNKNYDNDDYTERVIKPYKQIEEIQNELEENEVKPSVEHMMRALKLLKGILSAKLVDIDEQKRWFNQIIDETGMYYVLKDFEMPVK